MTRSQVSGHDIQKGGSDCDQRFDLGPGVGVVLGARIDVHSAAGLVFHRGPDQGPPLADGDLTLVFLAGRPGPASGVLDGLQRLADDILFDLDITEPSPEQARLFKAVREFDSYIRANAGRIPDHRERQRAGKAISTAFTESAVNQVISKRMVKKQQMHWTSRGAHLLLHVRTRVLNDQLANDFRRWYPGFNQAPDPVALAA
jgi:hypothetical protein